MSTNGFNEFDLKQYKQKLSILIKDYIESQGGKIRKFDVYYSDINTPKQEVHVLLELERKTSKPIDIGMFTFLETPNECQAFAKKAKQLALESMGMTEREYNEFYKNKALEEITQSFVQRLNDFERDFNLASDGLPAAQKTILATTIKNKIKKLELGDMPKKSGNSR